MINREEILPLGYLKKSPFTGSHEGMRYRLELIKEEDTSYLGAVIWEAPYCYEATSKDKRETETFPFIQEGIDQAADWLDEKWMEQKERWLKAKNNW